MAKGQKRTSKQEKKPKTVDKKKSGPNYMRADGPPQVTNINAQGTGRKK